MTGFSLRWAVAYVLVAGGCGEPLYSQEDRGSTLFAINGKLTSRSSQTLRLGGLLHASARVPLFASMAWTVSIAAGGLVQPEPDGGRSMSPVVEVASGPGVWW